MKKIIALILAAISIFCITTMGVAAEGEDEKMLKFNEEGKFKILQISDIQDRIVFRPLTKMFINDLLEKEDPDIVVLTGDNIAPGCPKISWYVEKCIDNFMKIFEEKGVPVAIVYGNHDEENCLDKQEQWAIYEKYDCFVGVADSEELKGYGTYYLPVMDKEGKEQKFTLWFFDSQMYNDENDLGGYGCVGKDQVDWYIRTEKALTEANDGKIIPSFAFQHIIVPEVYDVLYKVGETDEESGEVKELEAEGKCIDSQPIEWYGDYYAFPEEYADEDTFFNETCCPPRYSNGQADAMVDYGKVLGVASGHDHKNSFVIPYKGLDIVQTPTASFGSYGDINRGARVITLDENDLSDYDTDVIFFRDYYDLEDEKLYNQYVFNSDGAGYSVLDRLLAMVKYYSLVLLGK